VRGVLGGGRSRILRAIDSGYAGRFEWFSRTAFMRFEIGLQLFVNAGGEINVAAGDARAGGLRCIERLRAFRCAPALGQMEHAGIGPWIACLREWGRRRGHA